MTMETPIWLPSTPLSPEALGAVDNLERRLQQQIQETEQLQEQHRRQLEAAEYELPGDV